MLAKPNQTKQTKPYSTESGKTELQNHTYPNNTKIKQQDQTKPNKPKPTTPNHNQPNHTKTNQTKLNGFNYAKLSSSKNFKIFKMSDSAVQLLYGPVLI